jgi:hypothetical protein
MLTAHPPQDTGVTIGAPFLGSPWQPRFDWAFNLDRGVALKAKWDLIPGRGSTCRSPWAARRARSHVARRGGRFVTVCAESSRVKPRLVCGHIHEAYGEKTVDNAPSMPPVAMCAIGFPRAGGRRR